jgi:cytidylate kinase
MKIAIDGPAGSGKSTVAKRVAQQLGFKHIDTGAYYRWLTYQVLAKKIDVQNVPAITVLAEQTNFENIADELIRTPDVTSTVSAVSAIKSVRTVVVHEQRQAAAKYDVVMEGRDIGSVVFPDAEVKIFLTASVQERARRRYQELLDKGRHEQSLAVIEADIQRRDSIDSTRAASPLKKMPDAVELDTTSLTIDQVVEKIVTLAKERT